MDGCELLQMFAGGDALVKKIDRVFLLLLGR